MTGSAETVPFRSARSTSTRRSRTRSRSSDVASRPNVTSMSSGRRATPSATYRAVSDAIVVVLPVPALASSTTVPCGSGPHTSNGLDHPTSSCAMRSDHRAIDRAPKRVDSGPVGLLDEQPVERDRVAEREQVVVVDGLEPTTSRGRVLGGPELRAGAGQRVGLVATAGARVGVRQARRQRQGERAAHRLVVEGDEPLQDLARAARAR